VLFAGLAITIYYKNPDPFTVKYYFGLEFTSSIALILIGALVIGILIGTLITSLSVFKSKRQASKAQKQLVKAEKQVEMLRATPPENQLK